MNNAVLLLGTNMGRREVALIEAEKSLEKQTGNITRKSSIYETSPWGNINQASFLNQVMTISTALNANELLKEILKVEKEMGRLRKEKWEPRLIDIDILFFNAEIINTAGLTIPHPLIKERRFALVPLDEIMPEFVHPVFNRTIKDLLKSCSDTQDVDLYI